MEGAVIYGLVNTLVGQSLPRLFELVAVVTLAGFVWLRQQFPAIAALLARLEACGPAIPQHTE